MKNTICQRCMAGLCLLAAVLSPEAEAQITLTSSVMDGFGTRSSGGGYTNISAAAQPGGIGTSSGGGYVNQAGFLNTFALRPALDTDQDGLVDEFDQDNDGDGLADATEIAGSAFDPVTSTAVNQADSDGDGVSDGQESVAGTNPSDINAYLEITAVTLSGGGRVIEWVARSNRTYHLLRSGDPRQAPTSLVAIVTASGPASPPWYVQPVSALDVLPAEDDGIYAVDVQP